MLTIPIPSGGGSQTPWTSDVDPGGYTLSGIGSLNLSKTLNVATGNEVAYTLNYTTNKATSGDDTGLVINQTDTLSPGTSYLINAQVGGVSRFRVSNTGIGYFLAGVGIGGTLTIPINESIRTAAASTLYLQKFTATDNVARTYLYLLGGITNTVTSGNVVGLYLGPLYNQASGTAANTDLLINRTQTAVGSGAQLLIDAQVGSVSKFSVSNAGDVNLVGVLKIDGTQVVSNRVVDARIDDAINSGDATTDGVIDAIVDCLIAHGLVAAA